MAELLVELCLARLDGTPRRVADLGTGSGAIALALARERPAWRILATDRSADALEIAAINCRRLQIDNVALRQGSWCEALAGEQFDAILSNPPYIAPADPALGRLRHEPQQALVADEEGFADLLQIARCARAHLTAGGLLLHYWLRGALLHTLPYRRRFTPLLRIGQFLRPVLLTTITTILGLMPMALGMNLDLIGRSVQFGAPSTQWWQQLAMAIAFGLTFATVLTLIVTPCALMLRANMAAWSARRFRGREKQANEPELPLDLPKAAE